MLGPNKPRYSRGNVRFDNFSVFIKTYDSTNSRFVRHWEDTGFVGGNATIEWSTSAAELKAGVPRAMVARVITDIDATVRLTFVENDLENVSRVLFQQSLNFTTNTTTSSKTYSNVPTSAFQNIPSLSSNPIYILDAIPDINANFTVVDDNNNNVSSDFALRIRKGVAFIERTASSFPGTPPYDITITKYSSLRRDELKVFEDITKVGLPYKILIIGRNTINRTLRAIYIPSVVIDTPPTLGMQTDDFLKLEVVYRTLAEYPEGTSPLDLQFSPVYLIEADFEATTDPQIIASYFNYEVITDRPV